jgi:hypothetical protein
MVREKSAGRIDAIGIDKVLMNVLKPSACHMYDRSLLPTIIGNHICPRSCCAGETQGRGTCGREAKGKGGSRGAGYVVP